MKKLLLVMGVAASLAFTACNGSSNSPKNFTDSLSTAFGEYNGANLGTSFASIPEDQKKSFSKEDVLRGFKEVLLADTAEQGYYAGLNIALNMNQQLMEMEQSGVSIDRNLLLSAFSKAFMADSTSAETMEEYQKAFSEAMNKAQSIVMKKRQEQMEEQRAAREKEAAENLAAGEEYMAKIAKDEGVVTLPSGLAYKVVKQGEGPKATADDEVELNYVGKLIDGTVFDESKAPVTFVPTQTVPGFSEGLQLMNVGSEYILYVPAALGYGDRQAGSIPANSTLIFEVKILKITPRG